MQLQGIYTYRRSSSMENNAREMEKAGIEEGQLMVQLAENIRKEGIAIRDVSVGSTPTASYAA